MYIIWILAISLSLDALGVGMAYGLKHTYLPLTSKIIISLFSILYSAASLLLGKVLATSISPHISKFIGIGILLIMGVSMLLKAVQKENEKKSRRRLCNSENDKKDDTLLKFAINSLGITIYIIKNPVECDIDKSGKIDHKESIILGLALSVDAIGVGIGSALTHLNSMIIPIAIGICQYIFLDFGLFLGKKFASLEKINKKLISLLPGILLIILALLRI